MRRRPIIAAEGDCRIDDDPGGRGGPEGHRGNRQHPIADRVDRRRHRSVIFWCAPFTQTLARANLVGS